MIGRLICTHGKPGCLAFRELCAGAPRYMQHCSNFVGASSPATNENFTNANSTVYKTPNGAESKTDISSVDQNEKRTRTSDGSRTQKS